MKLSLLLLLTLSLKFIPQKEAKGYTVYFLTFLGLCLPILAFAVDLVPFYGSFKNYEILPWIIFWGVLPVSFYFLKDSFEEVHEVYPQIMALAIMSAGIGLFNLVLMELLFAWYILYNYKKLYSFLEFEFLFKFIVFILLIFQNKIVIIPHEYLVNSAFLTGIIYFVLYACVLDKNFFYLYTINFAILAHILPVESWISIEIIYACSGLIALKYIYSNLSQAKLVPMLKEKLKGFESVELKLRLILLKEGLVVFQSRQDPLIVKSKNVSIGDKKFVNDFASSLFITLLIIFALVAFFIYRLD